MKVIIMLIVCAGLRCIAAQSDLPRVLGYEEAEQMLLSLSRSVDWEDRVKLQQLRDLKNDSGRLLPLWTDKVRNSVRDREVSMAFILASAAGPEHAELLRQMALDFLGHRDVAALPLGSEGAVRLLGEYGSAEDAAVLERVAERGSEAVRFAVSKSLEKLVTGRVDPRQIPEEQKSPENSGEPEEEASILKWIVVLAGACLLLLCGWRLYRRSGGKSSL